MKELSDKQEETLQIKTQEYAASLQKLLERALRGENIRGKKGEMWIGDIADGVKICSLVRNFEYKKAYDFLYNSDTELFEQIPASIRRSLEYVFESEEE